MSKYKSQITLIETGDDLREDTWLRIEGVITSLLNRLQRSERDRLLPLIKDDVLMIKDRLSQ